MGMIGTNHVLVLGTPRGGQKDVAQLFDLPAEFEVNQSVKGQVANIKLKSKYYDVDVNLLLDEFPENCYETEVSKAEKLEGLKLWFEEFSGEECRELREVLDGIVFCIDLNQDTLDYVEKALEILDEIRESIDDDWEGFLTVVGFGGMGKDEGLITDIDDAVALNGMEFINFDSLGVNEFNEKLGSQRLLEVFHSHDWKDIDVRSKDYEKNKMDKAEQMTEGLLDNHETLGQDDKLRAEDIFAEEDDEDEFPGIQPDGKSIPTFNTRTKVKENVQMNLSDIFERLQFAKKNMENLDDKQKEAYAKNMINEIIDYI